LHTYVLDIPGGLGKVLVGPNHVSAEEGEAAVEDPAGRLHPYPPTAG
jgi:lysine 2,3-aminomutase